MFHFVQKEDIILASLSTKQLMFDEVGCLSKVNNSIQPYAVCWL